MNVLVEMDWAGLSGAVALFFGLALLVSAAGFYRLVYFISTGYAFSVTAIAVAALWLWRAQLDALTLVQGGLLIFYGLRLGIFLVRREVATEYQANAAEVHQQTAAVKLPQRLMIWVSVALLYTAMTVPLSVALVASASPLGMVVQALGVAIMALGLVVEAVADQQKSAFKVAHPKAFCNVGLYRMVRCPNYFGEIVFWLGHWVAALAFYSGLAAWGVSALGLVCITLIMFGSTKRLEHSQDKRYGAQPEYQEYVRTVPVLFPFVPIYTLKHIRVYLE